MSTRRTASRQLWIALLGLLLAAPASAEVTMVTGTLTTFIGTGAGFPSGPKPPESGSISGSAMASVTPGAFTLPPGMFQLQSTVTYPPTGVNNSVYVVREIVNQSNLSGSFSGTPRTGTMSIGLDFRQELGIVPLPNVFGAIDFPLGLGSPGSTVSVGTVLANAVTVTVIASGWTTGTISVNDQTVSHPTGTTATVGTAAGSNNLTAGGGGSITLVTPYVTLVRGALVDNRAGYAKLELSFVPEPSAPLLLGVGLLALLFAARRKG